MTVFPVLSGYKFLLHKMTGIFFSQTLPNEQVGVMLFNIHLGIHDTMVPPLFIDKLSHADLLNRERSRGHSSESWGLPAS